METLRTTRLHPKAGWPIHHGTGAGTVTSGHSSNGTKLRQLSVPVMHPDEQHEIACRIKTAFTWIDCLAAETVRQNE
jgi:hypothetical protein